MLIPRKPSTLIRNTTGLRLLHIRLQRVHLAFPISRDGFAILGSSKCECLSVLDLQDAFPTF